MELEGYEKMLERARSNVPEDIGEEQTFEPPKARGREEASTTIIENWNEILRAVNDQEKPLLRFLSHEIGTQGTIEGTRAEFKGNHSFRKINSLLEEFFTTYIICSECGRPDTQLKKEKHHLLKKCTACGAWEYVEPP